MENIAPLKVTFAVDTSGLRKAESAVSNVGKNVTGKMGGFGKAAGIALAAGVTAGLVGIGRSVSRLVGDAVLSAEDENASKARLDNIAKSMGIFGDQATNVSKRLQDLADKTSLNTGIDDGAIRMTQAKLLTFKELALTAGTVGGEFDRATNAALDLAAAGFGTAEGNAVQLGKALNDPIKGLTALSKSGVTFNEEEKQRIKTLVASNKVGEAQKVILKAIETQVGGTAEKTAKGSEKMARVFDNLKEDIGNALLPAVESFRGAILTAMPSIQEKLVPAIATLGEKIATDLVPKLIDALPAITATLGWFIDNIEGIMAFTGVLGGLIGTMKVLNVVTALQAGIFKAHPILALASILIPLIAYLVTLGIKSGYFSKVFKGVGDAINLVGAVISGVVENTSAAISGFFTGLFNFLGSVGENLYNFGKEAWQRFVQGALDALLTLPNLAADIIGNIPFIGEGISNTIKAGTGAVRQVVSNVTGTKNTAAPAQGNQQINYFNVSAQGLTVDAVAKDSRRKATLSAPVLGGA